MLFQHKRLNTQQRITSTAFADVDNMSKFVLDALQGRDKLLKNDAQISKIVAEKKFGPEDSTMVCIRKRIVDLSMDSDSSVDSDNLEI